MYTIKKDRRSNNPSKSGQKKDHKVNTHNLKPSRILTANDDSCFITIAGIIILLMISSIVTFQYAQAETGDPLFEINNPTPEDYDYFGSSVAGTINGNILVGARGDNTGVHNAGSIYLFEGISIAKRQSS